VTETYRQLWARRDDLIRLAIVPTLASFLLAILASGLPLDGTMLVIWLANLLPLTLFTVNWYRLSLLGPAGGAPGLGLSWEGRKTRFLIVNLLLVFGIVLVLAIPAVIIDGLLHQSVPGYAAMIVLVLVGFYLYLRLGLVLPAITVDHPYRLAQSWHDTAGCGLQLLVATVAAVLPILLVQQMFFALALGTGLVSAAPYAIAFLGSVPTYVWSAAATTMIALVFRRRTDWPGAGVMALRAQGST
jgi:hypothetical protein